MYVFKSVRGDGLKVLKFHPGIINGMHTACTLSFFGIINHPLHTKLIFK
jgi:hypothetical protein